MLKNTQFQVKVQNSYQQMWFQLSEVFIAEKDAYQSVILVNKYHYYWIIEVLFLI